MRSSSSSSDGTRNGMRACAIFRRARSSRAAIVGSGTRNARAVCAVLRPPSDFTVSATRAGSASDGWQHANSSRRRSSVREVSSSIVGSWACVTAEPSRSASASSVRSRSSSARVRRSRSIARRLAVVVSQAAGISGTPSRGHVASATA